MDSVKAVNLHLILLAGGKGLRAAGGDEKTPKQFQETSRGPLYLVCLEEFLTLQTDPKIQLASLTVTVPDSWREQVEQHLQEMEKSTRGQTLRVPWALAGAGLTRTESTWSAAGVLSGGNHCPGATDLVAVHDAARPFASADLLTRLSAAALVDKAAVPGIPVPDSLVQITNPESGSSQTRGYVDRASIFAVQTPQVFQWTEFFAAHDWAAEHGKSFTDDGSLLAQRGIMPQVVSGEIGNWKVTTANDRKRALALL